MKTHLDLWAAVGSLAEDETTHVLTRLVALYGDRLEKNPADLEAQNFFRNLDTAISQVTRCNLNRG